MPTEKKRNESSKTVRNNPMNMDLWFVSWSLQLQKLRHQHQTVDFRNSPA
jgi:hypothetical protein